MGNFSDSDIPYTEYRWLIKTGKITSDETEDVFSPISIGKSKEIENKLRELKKANNSSETSRGKEKEINELKKAFTFGRGNSVTYTDKSNTYYRVLTPTKSQTIFRKERYLTKCFDIVTPFQRNKIDELQVFFFDSIFCETFVDIENSFIIEFTNHLHILNYSFANEYRTKLLEHLNTNHNFKNETFSFVKLRNILAKDFSSCTAENLVPYNKYYIKNLNEYNFKEIIIQMLVEEGTIYNELNQILSGNFVNNNLLFFLLCVIFVFGAKTNYEDLTKSYFYLDDNIDMSIFEEKNVLMNNQLITGCKEKNFFFDNTLCKAKTIVEVEFENIEAKNWYLHFKGIDTTNLSQYSTENMIIILPFAVFEVTQITKKNKKTFIKLLLKTNVLSNISLMRMNPVLQSQLGICIADSNTTEKNKIKFHTNLTQIASLTILSNKNILLENITDVGCMKNLRVLNLSNLEITDEDLEEITPFLYNLTFLNYLNLSLNNISVKGIKTLSTCLSFMPFLEHLSVNQNNLGDLGTKQLAQVLSNNKNLRSLSIIYNQVRYSGIEQLILRMKNFENLNSLNCSTNFIYFEFYEDLEALLSNVKNMKNLVNLDFSNNQICNDGFKVLTEYMPSTIQRLNLSENEITQDGLMNFCLNLIKFPNLLELSFYGNKNGPTGINYLIDNLEYVPNLQIINFGCNFIGDAEILLFASNFYKLKNLKVLNLRENYITNEGVNFISKYIAELESLASLDLGCNNLTENPFDNDFSSIISNLKFFRSLVLENNNMEDMNFKYLLMSLQKYDKNWKVKREEFQRQVLIGDEQFASNYILQSKVKTPEIGEEHKKGLDSII